MVRVNLPGTYSSCIQCSVIQMSLDSSVNTQSRSESDSVSHSLFLRYSLKLLSGDIWWCQENVQVCNHQAFKLPVTLQRYNRPLSLMRCVSVSRLSPQPSWKNTSDLAWKEGEVSRHVPTSCWWMLSDEKISASKQWENSSDKMFSHI